MAALAIYMIYKMWSFKTGVFWWQTQLHCTLNLGPSTRNIWSFRTVGLCTCNWVYTTEGVEEVFEWNSETCLRYHCHERPPVLKDHRFLAEPTSQYTGICHQRPPVLRDHIFETNGVVFWDRFNCNTMPCNTVITVLQCLNLFKCTALLIAQTISHAAGSILTCVNTWTNNYLSSSIDHSHIAICPYSNQSKPSTRNLGSPPSDPRPASSIEGRSWSPGPGRRELSLQIFTTFGYHGNRATSSGCQISGVEYPRREIQIGSIPDWPRSLGVKKARDKERLAATSY